VKIALAQTASVKGDIFANILTHLTFIDRAVTLGADAVFFPELSVTGYEPTLAASLATTPDDPRLAVFQHTSDQKKVIIGIGLPLRSPEGISICMLLFRPFSPSSVYAKKYIHADEEPFFIHGENAPGLLLKNEGIALAICYEISNPEHAEQAFKNGASIYVASVVKTPDGADKAWQQLSAIAQKYGMVTMMCNAVGIADGGTCGGKSAAWNTSGRLLSQLDGEAEGILLYDTEAGLTKTG
jgi:predicted amidohydrolase